LAVPDFQTIMRPLLEIASDGKEHSLAEAREKLAQVFKLTDEEKRALLPSGKQATFTNRVAWARVYLGQAGALDTPKRGYFRITDRGHTFLHEAPQRITIKQLERFPEFHKFRTRTHKVETGEQEENGQTPEEMLDSAYQKFREGLASELLTRVKGSSAEFFEHLVVELLLKMGYGGSHKEAGEAEATGQSRWFERLLAQLNFELWIGDAAQIRAKQVRKQKNDRFRYVRLRLVASARDRTAPLPHNAQDAALRTLPFLCRQMRFAARSGDNRSL